MKLVNFLKKLKNEQVTVELKNGQTVFGTVSQVTPQMNLVLTQVQLRDGPGRRVTSTLPFHTQGNGVNLQYINIRGNTIRQIILPDTLNIDTILASMDHKELNQLRRDGKVGSVTGAHKRGRYQDNDVESQQPGGAQRQRRIAPMRGAY